MWPRNQDLPVPLCRRRGSLESCSAYRFICREKRAGEQKAGTRHKLVVEELVLGM